MKNMWNVLCGIAEVTLMVALVVGIVILLDSCVSSSSLYYQVSDFVNS